MKKRKRGRPEVLPDHLFAVFQVVEEERHRHPNLSVNSVCELISKRIAKFGPLELIDNRTGEKVEIASGKTLRSRYYEVLSALSQPRGPVRRGTREEVLLTRRERIIDERTGQPMEAMRIIGQWGPTKKLLQARRRASLLARRASRTANR